MKLPCICFITLCLLLPRMVFAQKSEIVEQSPLWSLVYGIYAGTDSLMTGAVGDFCAGSGIGFSYSWNAKGKQLRQHVEVLAIADVLYALDGFWYAGAGLSAGNKSAGSLEGLVYWKFGESESPWNLRLAVRVPLYETAEAPGFADISLLVSVLLPVSELAGAGVRADLLFEAVFIGLRISVRGLKTL